MGKAWIGIFGRENFLSLSASLFSSFFKNHHHHHHWPSIRRTSSRNLILIDLVSINFRCHGFVVVETTVTRYKRDRDRQTVDTKNTGKRGREKKLLGEIRIIEMCSGCFYFGTTYLHPKKKKKDWMCSLLCICWTVRRYHLKLRTTYEQNSDPTNRILI